MSNYRSISIPMSWSNGGIRTQKVRLTVCDDCGAVVGDEKVHDQRCTGRTQEPINE